MLDYTDGYAIRVVMSLRQEAMVYPDDTFGLIFSQFGYQQTYDSASQQEASITDVTANPREVQGWNGFAVVRSTDSHLDFDWNMRSL